MTVARYIYNYSWLVVMLVAALGMVACSGSSGPEWSEEEAIANVKYSYSGATGNERWSAQFEPELKRWQVNVVAPQALPPRNDRTYYVYETTGVVERATQNPTTSRDSTSTSTTKKGPEASAQSMPQHPAVIAKEDALAGKTLRDQAAFTTSFEHGYNSLSTGLIERDNTLIRASIPELTKTIQFDPANPKTMHVYLARALAYGALGEAENSNADIKAAQSLGANPMAINRTHTKIRQYLNQ